MCVTVLFSLVLEVKSCVPFNVGNIWILSVGYKGICDANYLILNSVRAIQIIAFL